MEPITSGNFTFIPTKIDGVIVVESRTYGDSRGSFKEIYKRTDFIAGGIDTEFVQDNQSSSIQGVLRGLHFQINHPQAKLVHVIQGEVFDVCVDLREGSPTYGEWTGVRLSAESNRQFFIPRGFAHGFYVLSETAIFAYKCDDVYHPGDEGGISWDDPDLGVEWPLLEGVELILSEKDRHHPAFRDIQASGGLPRSR